VLEGKLREELLGYLKTGGSVYDVVRLVFDYFGEEVPKTTEKRLKIADYGQFQITQKIVKWRGMTERVYTVADIPAWVTATVGIDGIAGVMKDLIREPWSDEHFAWYDGVWHFDAKGHYALALRCYGVGLITMDDAFRWLAEVGLKEEECEENSDAV